ncbi:hypothetical protein PQR62_07630 [Herbaspirillum lusitanum]|jgi:hypothetical protein|uniref:Glycosyltransferase n=1 Tax=Herbaspirillum lusitanum TaxID=213312 RepID=A0ABW9A6S2_9BURK
MSLDFNQRVTALLHTPTTLINAHHLLQECTQIELDNLYIPSGFLWAIEYKRSQICKVRGDTPGAIRHARKAVALVPYNNDVLAEYQSLVRKSAAIRNIALIISCKKYEAKALQLAQQYDDANIDYLIISGQDTLPIHHPRAIQVEAPDNYESLPRKTVAACTWVFENLGDNVGVLKVDDDQTLFDPARARLVLEQLRQMDVYAGVPVSGTTHDRNWHWNKCQDPALNSRSYGKPFHRPWAMGGAYYLGPGPLGKLVVAMTRFPGLYDGEYYEDKLVGDMMVLEQVELQNLSGYEDFGLSLTEQHRFNPG